MNDDARVCVHACVRVNKCCCCCCCSTFECYIAKCNSSLMPYELFCLTVLPSLNKDIILTRCICHILGFHLGASHDHYTCSYVVSLICKCYTITSISWMAYLDNNNHSNRLKCINNTLNARLIRIFLNSFDKCLYRMTTYVRSYINCIYNNK